MYALTLENARKCKEQASTHSCRCCSCVSRPVRAAPCTLETGRSRAKSLHKFAGRPPPSVVPEGVRSSPAAGTWAGWAPAEAGRGTCLPPPSSSRGFAGALTLLGLQTRFPELCLHAHVGGVLPVCLCPNFPCRRTWSHWTTVILVTFSWLITSAETLFPNTVTS